MVSKKDTDVKTKAPVAKKKTAAIKKKAATTKKRQKSDF